MDELETFREETRSWLEENCPDEIRSPATLTAIPSAEVTNAWRDKLAQRGWTTPTWPSEYGGGGLSKKEARVLAQEVAKIGSTIPPVSFFGTVMLGPVLLEYGNEEQKKEHLPKITSGEIQWCQGYSEPGSGSDLASLQTRCVKDGDQYVINGS
jgi:alkylation response protein AidB-like acyl-CoA dehydrogenase